MITILDSWYMRKYGCKYSEATLDELSTTVHDRLHWSRIHPPYMSVDYHMREQQLKEHNTQVLQGFKTYYAEQKNTAEECGIDKVLLFETYNSAWNKQHKDSPFSRGGS